MWNTSSWILLNRIRLVVSQFPVFNLAVASYLHADMREVAIASHLTLNKEANHCISQIKQKMIDPWCFFNAPSVAEGKNECIMKRFHSAHLRLYIHYFHVSSLFSFIAHCLFHSLFSLGGRSAHGLQQIREMLQAESQIIAHCLCGMAKNPPYSASFLAILSIFSEPSLNWQSHKTQKVCGTERVYKKKTDWTKDSFCSESVCLLDSPRVWHSLQHVHSQWAGTSYWPGPCSSWTWGKGEEGVGGGDRMRVTQDKDGKRGERQRHVFR